MKLISFYPFLHLKIYIKTPTWTIDLLKSCIVSKMTSFSSFKQSFPSSPVNFVGSAATALLVAHGPTHNVGPQKLLTVRLYNRVDSDNHVLTNTTAIAFK